MSVHNCYGTLYKVNFFCIAFKNIWKSSLPGDFKNSLGDLSDMVMSIIKIHQVLPFLGGSPDIPK